MWLIYCTNGFQSSITGNLTPYVTSGFEQHSLIPVISIVVSVMSAAVYLPVAKMLDLWGRPEGFTVMMVLATVGTIMMATTTNITTYCAAQVGASWLP
jgi:Na+/melibiose symporter-like transporter